MADDGRSTRRRPRFPSVLLISDARRVGLDRFLRVLAGAWAGGLRFLQVREGEDRELIEAILTAPRPENAIVVVNRSVGLCEEYALDGVHVGGGNPSAVATARDALGARAIIGYSAHREDELARAAAAGADYVTYSPIFGATSKVHPLPPVGLEGLRSACRLSALPVYALGGVTAENASSARNAGAAGVAVIGAVVDARDPQGVVRALVESESKP